MKVLTRSAAARALASGRMICCLNTDEWFQLRRTCSIRAARRRITMWQYYDPDRKVWGVPEGE